ncbi:MAG: hypothetical protein IJM25_11775 [Eubacterium sp.]|nr:hypothetical protein [Eubacterium sp.]
MAGLTWNNHSYKVAAKKRINEDSGSGHVLRKIVMIENILVMNEAQFRHFYKGFTMHDLIGGDEEDINCMKLSLAKELLMDLVGNIDERGVYNEKGKEEERVELV